MENFKTFRAEFAEPAHNIQPINTMEDFALEQLRHSLGLAKFWLEVAKQWAEDVKVSDQFFIDIADAIHHTDECDMQIPE